MLMMPLLKKRILAFLIDYLVILLYILALLGASLLIYHLVGTGPGRIPPLQGQLTGFFSLTLPVVLYFYFMEKSKHRGTIGKIKAGIYIDVKGRHHGKKLLIRNILKFIPWEIAHTGVHYVTFFSLNGEDTPTWVMVALILPLVIAAIYLYSIIHSHGRESLYDRIAGTTLKIKKSNDA